jgi:thiol:disulfide interchange protein
MKKNIILILLIFLVPIAVYYSLTKDNITQSQAIASTENEIIKFASPMCFECQELEKTMNEILPKYSDKISLRKIDITKQDKNTNALIQEYNVKLVPTTVFKKQNGQVTKRIEGAMRPEVLEQYMVELINE